jgi:hypothetical protein
VGLIGASQLLRQAAGGSNDPDWYEALAGFAR